MNTAIVFVHGAFHGGWCWEKITHRMRDSGHRLVAPSLIGCGERLDEIVRARSVDDYVDDLCAFLQHEVPEEWILVGHSFGSRSISGVADRMPDRVRRLIYFDGGIPIPGKASPARSAMAAMATGEVHGVPCLMPPPASFFYIHNPDDAAWAKQHYTPMPICMYETVLTLRHPLGNGCPATYIRCTKPVSTALADSVAYVAAQGIPVIDFEGDHTAMITAPDALANLLKSLV